MIDKFPRYQIDGKMTGDPAEMYAYMNETDDGPYWGVDEVAPYIAELEDACRVKDIRIARLEKTNADLTLKLLEKDNV